MQARRAHRSPATAADRSAPATATTSGSAARAAPVVRGGVPGVLAAVLVAAVGAAGGGVRPAHAQQVFSAQAPLPQGTRLDALRVQTPRQVLTVERAGSAQSYLIALGNMAFSAPQLFGAPARDAGISCATCHSEGDINRAFFIPGNSAHPGSADVSSALFNRKADDGLDNPLDIPSLRGIRFTAPYGRDGRFASLRAFTRNVIVNEFDGPEPEPLLLDALVAYQRQIEFLPSPQLGADGRLTAAASDAARRGAALFRQPFEAMGGRSCAGCHPPDAHFSDGQQHHVGTDSAYVTPSLRNSAVTAPYFARGSAADLGAVVAHFDRFYGLALSVSERADLTAYLQAVGAAEAPFEPKDFAFDLRELRVFAGTLPVSIAERDTAAVALTVDTVAAELREVRERWPDTEQRAVRALLAGWVLDLRRIARAAADGHWDAAGAAYRDWQRRIDAEQPQVAAAEPASLYATDRRRAHLAQLEALAEAAAPKPVSAPEGAEHPAAD